MEKKTPLYSLHLELGGKIVPFAGYLLPVQYPTGLIAEHKAVRTACGLFDVSHMGEILFEGKDALAALQYLLPNDMAGMENGRVRYSPVCNEEGGIVDDLIVYKLSDTKYMLVVNAANKDKDYAWFKQHVRGDVEVKDLSDSYAQLAIQGPQSKAILGKLCDESLLPVKYYSFTEHMQVAGVDCLVSRTGYTGEHGYELYFDPTHAIPLAKAILEAGKDFGLLPCGLGARDTLRLEAGMPLYGHEMSDTISPLEANLGLFIKMDKGDFIGRSALVARGEPRLTRVGLELKDRGIAREEQTVYLGDKAVGRTTSGTMAPYLGKAIAMALIDKEAAKPGLALHIDVRGRRLAAEIVPLPFYKKN